jgi:hypothetical protein
LRPRCRRAPKGSARAAILAARGVASAVRFRTRQRPEFPRVLRGIRLASRGSQACAG